MKKLLKACLALSLILTTYSVNIKAMGNPESAERIRIINDIQRINAYFGGMNLGSCSGRYHAIVDYLISVGTPMAYKILREMVASGELPAEYAKAKGISL